MFKIAVIGGSDSVVGFKALGLDTYEVDSPEQARKTLHEITKPRDDEYAIIYIEENFAQQLHNEIDKFKDSPSPAIILIPGREGSVGLGLQALHDAVERAVGTNILGD